MDTEKKYIFIFAKKKKIKEEKNLWKKLFSGREFLLAACPAYPRCHVFYPSYFILFYFILTILRIFIYWNREFHYFIPYL